MAYTLTPGAPNYWHEANPLSGRGNGNKRCGKLARYSFVARDDMGKPVRKWHAEIRRFSEQEQLSLRGIKEA